MKKKDIIDTTFTIITILLIVCGAFYIGYMKGMIDDVADCHYLRGEVDEYAQLTSRCILVAANITAQYATCVKEVVECRQGIKNVKGE